MYRERTFLAALAVVALMAGQAMAAVTTDIVTTDCTIKPGSADTNFNVDTTSGSVTSLSSDKTQMSLVTFDLSSLPTGAVITGAKVGVYDEFDVSNRNTIISLVNIDDWDEATLTWNLAAANLHAVIGTESINYVGTASAPMIDYAFVQWQGEMFMTEDPGFDWAHSRAGTELISGSDTYHGGVAWTEQDLVDALNVVLAGDQTAQFSITGASSHNQQFSDHTSTDGPGATLEITYEIPEPASLGLMGLGAVLVLVRKRR